MRSAALRGVLVGLGLLVLGAAVLGRLGWIDPTPRADGPAPWLISRATGITAFVALALDVIVGLAVSTRAAEPGLPRGGAIELHRWLSPVALALIAGHAGILLVDGFVPFDALDVMVPFVAPYRPVAVGLGVLAGYFALVVHLSFGFRKRIGPRTWRRLHYLSFVAFVAAAVHALLAGSDATRPWALAILAAPTIVVIALLIQRLTATSRTAPGRPARPR